VTIREKAFPAKTNNFVKLTTYLLANVSEFEFIYGLLDSGQVRVRGNMLEVNRSAPS